MLRSKSRKIVPAQAGDKDKMTRRELLQVFAGGAAATLLSGCSIPGLISRKPELLVWSCGGNYELLLDFNRRFEQLTNSRVVYTSAPVGNLVNLLLAKPRGVDVLVGRSGPGWKELKEAGRLAEKVRVFALDLYVIVTPPGNPANIHSVADLKRPGVRTVYSPTASGPSGEVPEIILRTADAVVEPGIWEGYKNNAIAAYDCGWKVFPPIIEGRADAALTRLSMTTVPETAGKVEVAYYIPSEIMQAMTSGRGATPQSTAMLSTTKNAELAQQYTDMLYGELGLEASDRHGYVHRLSPRAKDYLPLFKTGGGPQGEKGQGRGKVRLEDKPTSGRGAGGPGAQGADAPTLQRRRRQDDQLELGE